MPSTSGRRTRRSWIDRGSIGNLSTGAVATRHVAQRNNLQNLCVLGVLCGKCFVCVLLLFVLLLAAAPPEKHLSIYSTAANYSLPIVQRQGHDYIGLLELLDPLGTVSAKSEPNRWRIHYNNILGDFTVGKTHARVQGRDTDLSAKFLLENGRGLVPVASLASLLPRFLGGPATLHQDSGRLFIGSIATHFTAAASPDDPSHLVFHFTAPVNPSVATEPGKLRMTFRHDPVTAPASPTLTFDSKTIPSATYSENDGTAEISVTTTVPLLASFSPDGRTITLAPAKAQTATTPTNTPAATPTPPQTTPAAQSPSPTPTVPRRYFAIIDASHGGNDRGEALSTTLAEKDVTLAFARRLRQELENRGIPTLVLRDSDANLSLDDRAYYANTTHAAVYVALHAASNGRGVRLYTALLPYTSEEDHGPFRSWTTAQRSALALSQATATSVAAELKKQQVPVRTLTAPLRPLNNIVTAAIAIEVAPQSDVSQLTSPDYQQQIASAVANGILNIRAQLGAAP
jgi:N-acetylmuramoyl-L-alanine amidase